MKDFDDKVALMAIKKGLRKGPLRYEAHKNEFATFHEFIDFSGPIIRGEEADNRCQEEEPIAPPAAERWKGKNRGGNTNRNRDRGHRWGNNQQFTRPEENERGRRQRSRSPERRSLRGVYNSYHPLVKG